ncbi:MAG: exodeoxyribonuclease III [candidate division WOR-3 bacterium]|nr:MAG: exodeoxyribonuclease III [candidate division WOR-3 bacterium]
MVAKILSWNVNGLRAVHRKGFLDWLGDERPTILCVQETKASVERLPAELKDIPGYHVYYASAEKKGYSGVGVFSKLRPNTIESGIGIRKFDVEGRVLIADYGDFILFNIYFPNGKISKDRLKYKMAFYDAFLTHVAALQEEGKRLIVCGDVNTAHREIDLARPKENSKVSGFLPEERVWIDRFIGHGFIDTFRVFSEQAGQYTWWDLKTRARERNVGWRIDYFFITANLRKHLKNAYIMKDVRGSDHCPVGIDLTI